MSRGPLALLGRSADLVHKAPYACHFSDGSASCYGAASALHFLYAVAREPHFVASIVLVGGMADSFFFGLSSGTRDLLERVLEWKPDASFATSASRDLDSYEVFCGKGHLSNAMKAEA